ncbi:MAG: hypothetical protein OXE50_12625, partial [Chloroflexi bacterium]|nr:hypothetical protein [Chloroflexota bacterium]
MRNLIERIQSMARSTLRCAVVSIPWRGSGILQNLAERIGSMAPRRMRTAITFILRRGNGTLRQLARRMKTVAQRALRRAPGGDSPPREPVVKPPLPLPLCFMLSHLEDDGPVRIDGLKLGVFEVMGLELDEPKLGAFAGALNALDFPLQLLIRQHPPDRSRMRERLQEAQPGDLPPQTAAAAESLRGLLSSLEHRDGILDRRFYAVCPFDRAGDLRVLLGKAGLSAHPLAGRALRLFLLASAL